MSEPLQLVKRDLAVRHDLVYSSCRVAESAAPVFVVEVGALPAHGVEIGILVERDVAARLKKQLRIGDVVAFV